MNYYLAIDQGTTGTTAMLVKSDDLSVIGKVNHEFKQYYPKPGLVEHDLSEIWNSVKRCVKDVINEAAIKPNTIRAIGITNQRETTCAFKKNGEPLAKAIVWQDRRTLERCAQISNEQKTIIKQKTGLPTDPYFSASKIEWFIQNDSKVQEALKDNDCLFGTIDTFLIYKLTGHQSHVTEPSNASRTLLYNISEGQWDDHLLNLFSVPKKSLAQVKNSFGIFGKTKDLDFLPADIKISGCLGDQQSALFGQACFNKGESKCTYGTGAFYLINTGKDKVYSKNGLLTTIAYQDHDGPRYALEGSSYIAGAAVQWLRDNLNIIEDAPSIEEMALKTTLEKIESLLFLPFFTGIASPYWVSDAKATITGITRDTGNHEIARACLEGIALSVNDLLKSSAVDSGIEIKDLKVDGGACSNNLLMGMQATLGNLEIIRPQIIETTAYGAALTASVGIEDYKLEDLKGLWSKEQSFRPNQDEKEYFLRKKEYWKKTIEKLYL